MYKIWMKKPASWAGELWRESLPMGNGRTSALMCGSIGYEHIWVNRSDRWEDGEDSTLPDVHDTLPQAREWIMQGRYAEANDLLAKTLNERGYKPRMATPMAPVEIRLRFENEQPYRSYRRGVDLDTGEAFVSFEQGAVQFDRRAFISRSEDQFVLRIRATDKLNVKVDKPFDQRLRLKLLLGSGGRLLDRGEYFHVEEAQDLLLIVRFDTDPAVDSYEHMLERHLPLHRTAMGDAALWLDGSDHNTEMLLDDAAQSEASAELCEKLWRFGRYLFVSGTCQDGGPFPLYGLWNGIAHPIWAQNVANENIEMIYWHAPTGGYAPMLKPLIHYYYKKMEAFHEAARKLFGCRGIYVSTYTTPLNSLPVPNVPVIVNYIGCAGWLSSHFFDYYRYTQDDALLKSEILPFMMEAAAFYEDYIVRDANGRIAIIPSVSPENTPGNFMPEDFHLHMGHQNPVVWNATMDFAILRELLTHLLEINQTFPLNEARVSNWRAILNDLPDYQVNSDGAIREWMDGRLDDFYLHRHLSHLYPLFPGEEIHPDHPLFPACKKAVELRKLGGLSGWSLAHMSAIHARLGQSEQAISRLDTLVKGCLLPNLFTLHNDWRDMGVTLQIDVAPVQLDALMGVVNAIQEMLFRASPGRLTFLPACPERFAKGKAHHWRFPGGWVNFRWNLAEWCCEAEIVAERSVSIAIICPLWRSGEERVATLATGETLHLA